MRTALTAVLLLAFAATARAAVEPVPPWRIEGPVIAPLPQSRVPVTAGAQAADQSAVTVDAGGAEQVAMLAGRLQVPSAVVEPPAVAEWLDGWYWPRWRGQPPALPDGATPLIAWPSQAGAVPAGPHLVAVAASATMPMQPLAEFLAADKTAVAVIVGWEATKHNFRANAESDPATAAAVAAAVRASRPGLPVWLLHSLTVTGDPAQAAANVKAVSPDALVVYGLFAPAAWETDAIVTTNLQAAQALLPGKPVYAAGPRFSGPQQQQAIERARRLGWKGIICDGSAAP